MMVTTMSRFGTIRHLIRYRLILRKSTRFIDNTTTAPLLQNYKLRSHCLTAPTNMLPEATPNFKTSLSAPGPYRVYKRSVARCITRKNKKYPPSPQNYKLRSRCLTAPTNMLPEATPNYKANRTAPRPYRVYRRSVARCISRKNKK